MALNIHQKLAKINTFIFDVDGVFTPSKIILSAENEWERIMHTQDGYAVKRAVQAGYNVAIITKAISKPVKYRFEQLGVKHIYQLTGAKLPAYENYRTLVSGELYDLYLGDDLSDLPVLQACYVSACPNDAVIEVLHSCDFISPKNGGEACVRSIIERVMRIQDKW